MRIFLIGSISKIAKRSPKHVQNVDYLEDIHSEILSGLSSRRGDMSYDIMKTSEISRNERTQKIKSIINEVK